MANTLTWQNTTFLDEVQRRSGTPVGACFQCHKCSTGCPIAPEMDLLSSQVMRMIHYGRERELLELKRQGVEQVEIMNGVKPCRACRRLSGKVFDLEDALERMPLPHKDCEAYWHSRWRGFCRCFYVPALGWTG